MFRARGMVNNGDLRKIHFLRWPLQVGAHVVEWEHTSAGGSTHRAGGSTPGSTHTWSTDRAVYSIIAKGSRFKG
jgi:hypothetical protein